MKIFERSAHELSTPSGSPSRKTMAISISLHFLMAGLIVTPVRAASVPGSGPKVTVSPVEIKVISSFDEITGHVEATETVELRARVSGHLESVEFKAGQIVNKGDLLFTIDSRWYRAQFDLATARAEVAEHEAKRADELRAAEAISIEEVEARRARSAEARAELTTARLDLEHTEVRAPIKGRISRALVTTGNLVSGIPGAATELATIVSVGEVYVYADMDEATVLQFNRAAQTIIARGSDERIGVDLQLADESGYPRHGYIESTDNRLNAATGSLLLRLIFPNDDGVLVPGLFARVRIPISAPKPTLLVSERGIQTDQGQKFVLVVGTDHLATYRTVKLGGTVDGKRIVQEGLSANELVIVDGLQRVSPGSPVDSGPAVPPTNAANKVAASF